MSPCCTDWDVCWGCCCPPRVPSLPAWPGASPPAPPCASADPPVSASAPGANTGSRLLHRHEVRSFWEGGILINPLLPQMCGHGLGPDNQGRGAGGQAAPGGAQGPEQHGLRPGEHLGVAIIMVITWRFRCTASGTGWTSPPSISAPAPTPGPWLAPAWWVFGEYSEIELRQFLWLQGDSGGPLQCNLKVKCHLCVESLHIISSDIENKDCTTLPLVTTSN